MDLTPHYGLIFREARRLGPVLDVEPGDLVSYGWLGLVRASELYDPSRGASFGTFARTKISFYMRSGSRQDRGRSRRMPDFYSIQDDGAYEAEPEAFLEEVFEEVVCRMSDPTGARWSATGPEVARMVWTESMSQKAVAARLGVSESRISQILREFRERLESLRVDLA